MSLALLNINNQIQKKSFQPTEQNRKSCRKSRMGRSIYKTWILNPPWIHENKAHLNCRKEKIYHGIVTLYSNSSICMHTFSVSHSGINIELETILRNHIWSKWITLFSHFLCKYYTVFLFKFALYIVFYTILSAHLTPFTCTFFL